MTCSLMVATLSTNSLRIFMAPFYWLMGVTRCIRAVAGSDDKVIQGRWRCNSLFRFGLWGVKRSTGGIDLIASEIFLPHCSCWQQTACLALLLMHWGTVAQAYGTKATTTVRSTNSQRPPPSAFDSYLKMSCFSAMQITGKQKRCMDTINRINGYQTWRESKVMKTIIWLCDE